MKNIIVKILTAIIAIGVSQGLFANGFPLVWVDCNADPENNSMHQEYIGSEMYCYRVKFRCDQGLFGGFLVEVNTDDGGVGLGGWIDDFQGHFCFMEFGHLGNSNFSHSCDFEIGKAELGVKAVNGEKCLGY